MQKQLNNIVDEVKTVLVKTIPKNFSGAFVVPITLKNIKQNSEKNLNNINYLEHQIMWSLLLHCRVSSQPMMQLLKFPKLYIISK